MTKNTTTLNKIRDHSPCQDGWETLLKTLHKTKADDEPLSFKTILSSNGLDDAIWCLRTCDDDKKLRLFAADCAERVLHIFEEKHPNDNRPRLAIQAARDFVNGKIDEKTKATAWDTAWEAAEAAWAAWAAMDAARDAEEKEQIKLFKKYFCKV